VQIILTSAKSKRLGQNNEEKTGLLYSINILQLGLQKIFVACRGANELTAV